MHQWRWGRIWERSNRRERDSIIGKYGRRYNEITRRIGDDQTEI